MPYIPRSAKFLAVFLLCLLLPQIAPAAGLPVGKCVRDGDVGVCNFGCRGFNFANADASWPQGEATFAELVVAVVGPARPLTPKELGLCNGTIAPVVVPPMWRVAVSGTRLDRPAKLISADIDGNVILISAPKSIRFKVGEACDNSLPTFTKPSSGGKEWRYFSGQKVYVVLCEYK